MRVGIATALICLFGFGTWAAGLLPFGPSRPKDGIQADVNLGGNKAAPAASVTKPRSSDTSAGNDLVGTKSSPQNSAPIQPVRTAANSHAPLNRRGNWRIDNGELVVISTEQQSVINFGDLNWTDYDFSYKTRRTEGISILGGKFHQSAAGLWGNFSLGVFATHNGWRMGFQDPEQPQSLRRGIQKGQLPVVTDRWYDVQIKCRGTSFSASVDGKELVDNSRHFNATKGAVGLWASGPGQACFKDVKVMAPDGSLLWDGLPDPNLSLGSITSDVLPELSGEDSTPSVKDTE